MPVDLKLLCKLLWHARVLPEGALEQALRTPEGSRDNLIGILQAGATIIFLQIETIFDAHEARV